MADCLTCDRVFVHSMAATQHMNAVGHWPECERCDRTFTSHHAARQHMDAVNHWKQMYSCQTPGCDLLFRTNELGRAHQDAANHWRVHYCADCDRGFRDENGLRMHLNGSAHRANSIQCPFCKASYTTASGVAHHLETGSCPRAASLNRETIYQQIRRLDTTGIIVNKQLEWHSQENESFVATSATWNGDHYECYLCHRGFQSLRALNQHLDSPAHKQKVYHCFGSAGKPCRKQFPTIAALFSHLESESCGATRFETVQQNATNLFNGRAIGWR